MEKLKYECPEIIISDFELKDSIAASGETQDGAGLWGAIWG